MAKHPILCPYCKTNYVLWAFAGGFLCCYKEECKTKALDDAMDAELAQH